MGFNAFGRYGVMDAGSFKKYMEERFGIRPSGTVFEDKDNMVRVFSKRLMSSPVKGIRGFPAWDMGTTHYFSTMFGNLAMRNFVELKKEDAEALVSEKTMRSDLPDGEYIGRTKGKGACTMDVKKGEARAFLPALLKDRKGKTMD